MPKEEVQKIIDEINAALSELLNTPDVSRIISLPPDPNPWVEGGEIKRQIRYTVHPDGSREMVGECTWTPLEYPESINLVLSDSFYEECRRLEENPYNEFPGLDEECPDEDPRELCT